MRLDGEEGVEKTVRVLRGDASATVLNFHKNLISLVEARTDHQVARAVGYGYHGPPAYRGRGLCSGAQVEANSPQSHDSQTPDDEYIPVVAPTFGRGRYQVPQSGEFAMLTRSNIAVIAAFLTALAGPAYAANGDSGFSARAQDASQGARTSFTNTHAWASVDTRRESRPRTTEGSSSAPDFNLIGHN
jgi:hypothetical protein